jgi:hypothetical protein
MSRLNFLYKGMVVHPNQPYPAETDVSLVVLCRHARYLPRLSSSMKLMRWAASAGVPWETTSETRPSTRWGFLLAESASGQCGLPYSPLLFNVSSATLFVWPGAYSFPSAGIHTDSPGLPQDCKLFLYDLRSLGVYTGHETMQFVGALKSALLTQGQGSSRSCTVFV